ncbi:hypothetical protein LCGC14_2709750, partial [marine sediment metagenome]
VNNFNEVNSFLDEEEEEETTEQKKEYSNSNFEKELNKEIKEKMKFNLDITDSIDNWYGVVRKNIIIQNNRTEQFFTIDHADQCNEISEDLASHPLCISILKCQYRKGFYGKWEHMVSAFTYGVKEWNKYFNLREYLIKVPKEKNQMYFKGNENGRKHILVNLLEKGLINKDYGLRTHNGGGRLKATQEEYLKNLLESGYTLEESLQFDIFYYYFRCMKLKNYPKKWNMLSKKEIYKLPGIKEIIKNG